MEEKETMNNDLKEHVQNTLDKRRLNKPKKSKRYFRLFIPDSELDKNSFRYKYRHADIGNNALGAPFKDKSRIGQRILNLFTTIFGVNVFSFGLIGSICFNFFGITLSPPISLVISALCVGFLIILRKIIAALTGHVNEKIE